MKVKMLTTVAGPDFTARDRDVIDVPDETGQAWIEGRFAEAVVEVVKAPTRPAIDGIAWTREKLDPLTVADLTGIAGNVGVKLPNRPRKAVIVDMILAYQEQQAAAEDEAAEDEGTVETAEVAQGEQAAQTGSPPARQRQPVGDGGP